MVARRRTVEDSLCTVQSLLAKSEYVIGDYQRAYQWKPKDRENLLHDILDKRTPIGHTHFIGLIITHEGAVRDSVITHRIIDGQQRLTTLLLFMRAIELEAERVIITNTYQKISRDRLYEKIKVQLESDAGVSRISSLDPKQDADLEQIMFYVSNRTNTYKSPLNNCRKLIRERLNNVLTIKELSKILDALLDCKVLHLPSKKIGNPYTVFNTINNRGEDLKPVDLFKSLTIDLCREAQKRKKAAEIWWDIKSAHIDADIKSWNVLRTGIKPSPKDTFETLQATFESSSHPGRDSLELLKEIKAVAIGLAAIRDSDIGLIKSSYKNKTWANAHIKSAISELKIREAIPLFYAAFVKCTRVSVFEKALLSTVRVSMRILKANTGANRSLPKLFHKYAHEFWQNGSSAYNGYKKELTLLIEKHCNDDQFESLINSLRYGVDNVAVRQLLIGIEESMAWINKGTGNHISMIDKSRVIQGEAVSIDHIIARHHNPKGVHLIGNLTLMGGDPNSLAGCDIPEAKKAILECSPYATTRDVMRKRRWDDETIMARQKTLINQAKHVFMPV